MRYPNKDLVQISDRDITDIVRIEEALNASPISASLGIPFRVGQEVRITRGIFLNHQTKILAIDGRRKISVEVPMFGSAVCVILPVEDIEAA
jgi:transcription antitermination factor NusG